jgi:hypothetical protein
MLINALNKNLLKKIFFTCIFIISFFIQAISQNVWENTNSEVLPFLYRMAQKGFIECNDLIKPINRVSVFNALSNLKNKDSVLTNIEKNELAFYLQEYNSPLKQQISLFKKDQNKRWRAGAIVANDFELYIDPLLGINNFTGTNKNIQQLSNGFELWGTAGKNKNLGYQVYYRDYTETGTVKNNFREESDTPGNILIGAKSDNKINYTDIRANINYSFRKGNISLGKDNIMWGYGENSNIVLSNKAPSYPYFRLDYKPLTWLSFNYTHAWLNSNIADSSLSYLTNSGRINNDFRLLFVQKFLATHSFEVQAMKGLNIAIGESIVYSDKMDPGFLIPVNLFKFYDNNRSNYLIEAGSNGQYFLSLSSRNQLKNTHLYSTLFIDEIKVSSLFNKTESRNQLGFNLGGSITDLFIPYLSIGAEYTRVNPFVYSNLIPAQTYTSYNYSLGDWMGNDFDRAIIFAKYTPMAKLKLVARYQKIREGGAGTIYQQYAVQPQPSFLFDYIKTRSDVFLQVRYEYINNIYLNGSLTLMQTKLANGNLIKDNTYQLGISVGLP